MSPQTLDQHPNANMTTLYKTSIDESSLWFMSMTLTDLFHDQGKYLNVMYLHEVNKVINQGRSLC